MITSQHPTFCPILPSLFTQPLKKRNPFFHHHHQQQQQHFPKSKAFRISSFSGAGSFHDIAQIAHNKVLIAAGTSVLIGQLFKPFTSVLLYGKKFDIKAVIQAGGFPSSHSSATVACATFLGLERGFSDPIFGLTVVYAGLIMYDAQGVRREVGIHARTVNKIILQMHVNSLHSKDKDGLINSKPGFSTPLNVEGLEKSLLSQEANSLDQKHANNNARLLIKSGNKTRQTDGELLSSGFSTDAEEISELVADGQLPLKESIGHTEVEVIAGALLGILVGLAVHNFM